MNIVLRQPSDIHPLAALRASLSCRLFRLASFRSLRSALRARRSSLVSLAFSDFRASFAALRSARATLLSLLASFLALRSSLDSFFKPSRRPGTDSWSSLAGVASVASSVELGVIVPQSTPPLTNEA